MNVHKHKKISLCRTLWDDAGKQVSVETKKALRQPISASRKAKESTEVSTETKIASRQCLYTAWEVRKAFCKPKTAFKVIWIKKSNSARKKSLDSVSCDANLALHRAQPSCPAKLRSKHLYVLITKLI